MIAVFLFLSAINLSFADETKNSAAFSLKLISPEETGDFIDDGKIKELRRSVENSVNYFNQCPEQTVFSYGKDIYTAKQMAKSLKYLSRYLKRNPSKKKLSRFIKNEFLIYRAVNGIPEKPITYSAYFEPTMTVRFKPDEIYRYPVYSRPPDLVDANLEWFDSKKRGERIVGKVEGKNLVPYCTREEIDSEKILQGKGLEIAWAKDPVDILYMQIQGSGSIETPDKKKRYHIQYAGDNGRPYKSIGLFLIEQGIFSREEFTKDKMIHYLKSISTDERQKVLNYNPRYVFFEIVPATAPAVGSLTVPLTAGRSIASDPKYYPAGALCFVKTERPVFGSKMKYKGKKPLSRFVLNQDEGGAIKGTGRIDYFAGRGKEAEKMAEKLWFPGELYFFVKKSSEN